MSRNMAIAKRMHERIPRFEAMDAELPAHFHYKRAENKFTIKIYLCP